MMTERVSSQAVPLIVLAGVREEEADLASMAVTSSLASPATLRYRLDAAQETLFVLAADAAGVIDERHAPVAGRCLTCALREDAVLMLERLGSRGGCGAAVLRLPDAYPAAPFVGALAQQLAKPAMPKVFEPRAVVAAFSGRRLLEDIFGDELLEELAPLRHRGDRRSVGEVLAAQVEYADVLIDVEGPLERAAHALLDELRRPTSVVIDDLATLDAELLVGAPHAVEEATTFIDPVNRSPRQQPAFPEEVVEISAVPGTKVWTLFVDTWRPFHPARLLEQLESIGGRGMRGRGCFWLPTRADGYNVWDGAGAQLSIGPGAPWGARRPRTRLVITGRDGDPYAVADAMRSVLMTDAELVAGLPSWVGVPDGFDQWLGAQRDAA
jgi:G3E family GTPase